MRAAPAKEDGRAGDGAVLARRIALTAATGLFTFAISATLDGALQVTLAEQLILTAIVGSVTLLIQFLADFERRLSDLETESLRRLDLLRNEQRSNVAEARAVIDEGFARVNKATELYTKLEASVLHTDALTQLVRSSSLINGRPPVVRALAQSEIERMSALLQSLSGNSDLVYEGEDQEYLLGLTAASRTSIAATSLTTVDAGPDSLDGGFWTSDLGRRYLEAQRQARKRDVEIRRIFILDDLKHPSFEAVRELQREADVSVRVLDRGRVPPRLAWAVVDFILFDQAVCYETVPSGALGDRHGPSIVTTRLVLAEARVQRRTEGFEALWRAATEVA